MRLNRGLLFWGLVFLSAGVVALAVRLGFVDQGVVADAWRLWPLILVALGLGLVLSRTPYSAIGAALAALVIGLIGGSVLALGPGIGLSCTGNGAGPAALHSSSGMFGDKATLDWRLNCGSLSVDLSDGSDWTARVGSDRDPQPSVTGSADRLAITSPDNGFSFDRGRERWEVSLPRKTRYVLDLQANAADARLNLSGASLTTLSLEPNAGSTRLDLSGATVQGMVLQLNAGSVKIVATDGTSLTGQLETNAGSIDLCAPASMPLRITASGTAFGTNLDGSGLTRSGDTWESAAYAGGGSSITLTVHGNAGSFNLNPSGGCD